MDPRPAEREFEHPVLGDSTLPRMFEESADRNTARPAQAYKGGILDRTLAPDVFEPAPEGEYRSISYGQMRDVVRNLAAGFRDLGVGPDDRVGIFAQTRMEWAQCDFALLAAGAAVTSVYRSSSESQVAHILGDAGATGVVVEGDSELDRVLAVEDDLDVEFVVVMDAHDDRGREDVHSLLDVHERGRAAFDRETYEGWLDARDPGDLAALIYTSGTTGTPKGVQLTHRNFRANVDQCFRRFGPRPGKRDRALTPEDRALSYLPLAHVFERLAGHYLMFAIGTQVSYAESPDTLRDDFAAVRPTTATSVPRVYERLYEAVREEASTSPVRKRIFEWAVDTGVAFQEADGPGAVLSAKAAVADALVFRRVRDALGGEVNFLISGGGSLSPDLCALYHGMGLPILEGYGLTETAPVLTVNPPDAPRVGTIGPPVVDTEIRLDESVATADLGDDAGGEVGELLVRGPQVTDGYWNLPDATEAAFADSEDDGDPWFRTGDIVERTDDDYLVFLERAKALLALSTGKNVAPGPIEDAFATSELVEQAMVLGDGRKYVAAIVVPNFDALRAWADRAGVDLPPDTDAVCDHPPVRERVQAEVDRVNERFEPHEQVKRFELVPEEFSEEADTLTPTMKKKRRNILDRYDDRVQRLYESESP